MSIPTVYKSTDVGAPTLNGLVGTLIDVLKACLVDGYGSQAALGWTLEFEDPGGEIAVFRAPSGERRYFRFDHSSGASATYPGQLARVDGYETMSDHSSGSGNWHGGWIQCTYSASANARGWVLVGDESAFYFWHRTNSSDITTRDGSYNRMDFFGDIVPANPADVNLATLSASSLEVAGFNDNNRFCNHAAATDQYSGCICRRNVAGTAVSYVCPDGMFGTDFGNALHGARAATQSSQRNYTALPCLDEDGEFKGFMPGLYVSSTHNDYLNTLWDAYDTNFLLFQCRNSTQYATGYLRIDLDWRV